jgi:hypothetical protein
MCCYAPDYFILQNKINEIEIVTMIDNRQDPEKIADELGRFV